MPRRPRVPCGHPGCPALVEPGTKFCEKHKPLHPEVTRPATKRGYGSRWQKASKAFLQSHPLCAECMKQGRYTKATVVDHIVPHRGDQKLFWDRSNWQPLCKACHDRKTCGRITVRNTSTEMEPQSEPCAPPGPGSLHCGKVTGRPAAPLL